MNLQVVEYERVSPAEGGRSKAQRPGSPATEPQAQAQAEGEDREREEKIT